MPQILVIGAGISGLSVAYRLQERLPHADIQVLEAAERAGGTTWTQNADGFRVEMGPNGFLDTKPSTLQLCRDVGLKEQLVPASPAAGKNRYLFLDGRLRPLPAGVGAFLRSDLLSWRGKLSFLLERCRGKFDDATDESIDAFARRRAGNEAADIFADAMVTGIYAGDPTRLSLPACFPRLAELERTYGSIIKGMARTAKLRRSEAAARGEPYRRPGQMWSLAGGLRTLIEALTAQLRRPPLYGVNVCNLHRDPASPSWIARADGKESWQADAVVLTCPAYRQAEILADLDSELAREVSEIAYNRVAVVALGYRRADVPGALEGFGYIAPQRTRRDVLGVQWCSSIFPDRAPEGAVLLRALCGGWQRAEMVDWDEPRLLAAVRAELRVAMGITAEPIFHRVVRWERAIPQYHVGHLARLARLETILRRHPGLELGGNAYRGVALNDCTEQGIVLAERVARFLNQRA
jgi:protoporphyrinogen/coproporphyrinogen III oxidase